MTIQATTAEAEKPPLDKEASVVVVHRLVSPLSWEPWDYGDESYKARGDDDTWYYVVRKDDARRCTAWKHDGIPPSWRRPLLKCLWGGAIEDLELCKDSCARDWANAKCGATEAKGTKS